MIKKTRFKQLDPFSFFFFQYSILILKRVREKVNSKQKMIILITTTGCVNLMQRKLSSFSVLLRAFSQLALHVLDPPPPSFYLVSTPLGWPTMLLVLPRLLQRRSVHVAAAAAAHVRGSTRPGHKLVLQRLHKVHVGLLLLLLVGPDVAVAAQATAAGVVGVLHGQGLKVILQVQIVHKVPRRWCHPLLGPSTAASAAGTATHG